MAKFRHISRKIGFLPWVLPRAHWGGRVFQVAEATWKNGKTQGRKPIFAQCGARFARSWSKIDHF